MLSSDRNTTQSRRCGICCDTATTTGYGCACIASCITEGNAIRHRTIGITGVRCINRRPGIPTGVAINNRPISNRISSRTEGDNWSANRLRAVKVSDIVVSFGKRRGTVDAIETLLKVGAELSIAT